MTNPFLGLTYINLSPDHEKELADSLLLDKACTGPFHNDSLKKIWRKNLHFNFVLGCGNKPIYVWSLTLNLFIQTIITLEIFVHKHAFNK